MADLKLLFAGDIRAEQAHLGRAMEAQGTGGGGGSGSAGGSGDAAPPPKRQEKESFVARAASLAKVMGLGDGINGVRSTPPTSRKRWCSPPPPSRLSLLARVQAAESELARFFFNSKMRLSTRLTRLRRMAMLFRFAGEKTSWAGVCRRQFAFPCLARLATKYLAIPLSSAASRRIFSAAGGIVTTGIMQSMWLFS